MLAESVTLTRDAPVARRSYWQDLYEGALAACDEGAAAQALRLVQEYDSLIQLIDYKAAAQTG
jgi:hypothetical protein